MELQRLIITHVACSSFSRHPLHGRRHHNLIPSPDEDRSFAAVTIARARTSHENRGGSAFSVRRVKFVHWISRAVMSWTEKGKVCVAASFLWGALFGRRTRAQG